MKKIIGLMAVLLLVFMSANAQNKDVQNGFFFLSITAGPSIPVSDFASKNFDNSQAGFAKTGVDVNLDFGYQLHQYFGIVSTFLYSNNSLDISDFSETGISVDHWQYYGGLAGPMLTLPINEKAKVDFKLLAGITNVNFPTFKIDGTTVSNEEWSTSFAMQFGTDLRYNVQRNLYLITKLDYNFMKPNFNISVYDPDGGHESTSGEQKISAVNFSAGLAINF